MITITPKIDNIDLANDTFYCYVGNHGFLIQINRLKEMVAKTRNEEVAQDMVYFICVQKIAALSKQLGINPKDLTFAQIKNAIETETEI